MYKYYLDYIIIRASRLFDSSYYLRKYKDIRQADVDPLWHFIRHGWMEGRKPNETFETEDYVDSNPEVWREKINPLVHYIRFNENDEWFSKGHDISRISAPFSSIRGDGVYKKNDGANHSIRRSSNRITRRTFDAIYYLRAYGIKEFIKKIIDKVYLPQKAHNQHIGSGQLNLFYSRSDRTDKKEYLPKVSVIVPNYNHARFLEQRLESIYQQTYKNVEIILLDDGSTDDSLQILNRFANQNADSTRCEFNEINSGSPFSQWQKGVSLATGDLIWIAESDDFCEKNFLEKLVPFFADESIMLSYAYTQFVDFSGKKNPFAFENYVSQVDPKKWTTSFVETAHQAVNSGLGVLNTIPNVSSVLFRKIGGRFALFADGEWLNMKVCGDWLFYLHIIRGGRIAFCHDTCSYYRIHQTGSSKKAQTQDVYYKEHEKVGCAIASLYKVSDSLLDQFHSMVKNFYFENIKDGSQEKFNKLFDYRNIINSKNNRKPNILIATYAFSFGGGEIFPIHLANALRNNGLSVLIFNGEFEPTQGGVRQKLSAQIPVITNSPTLDINELLEDFGIEIIHTHHASMENFFARAKVKASSGVKHIATMHGMYEMMDNFLRNTREIQKSVDHWLYISEKNIAPFRQHNLYSDRKFTKIENGMPNPESSPVDLTVEEIESTAFTACIASRALPEKGWKEAIDAISLAREKTKRNLHLLLIGEGPIYNVLKNEELPKYIHLLGYKPNVADYLSSSQLGLIPSYYKGESFPLIMIECFMAGIPVIASRIGEIEKMMTDDDHRMGGVIFSLRNEKVDPDDLENAIEKIVTDTNYYQECATTARSLAKRYDIDNIAKRHIAIYKELLK